MLVVSSQTMTYDHLLQAATWLIDAQVDEATIMDKSMDGAMYV